MTSMVYGLLTGLILFGGGTAMQVLGDRWDEPTVVLVTTLVVALAASVLLLGRERSRRAIR